MRESFESLLLSELRMVTYQPGNPADLTDELLSRAVTLNVNLSSLGYVLTVEDLLRIAVSPSLDGFYKHLEALVPDVKAKPMYPDFPLYVMGMSEAQFRLHQYLHYFSTYGLEALLGEKVQRGWLPDVEETEKTKKDKKLLSERVIELVPEGEAPFAVLRVLLDRRERLTNPELDLVLWCAPLCSVQELGELRVRFKENLLLLFPLLMEQSDREAALRVLHALCAHTGDVFRCAGDYLHTKRWHLSTAEKKLLVKLLESYPVSNLCQNMMSSARGREHSLLVLAHLDYNRFSRSPGHREAVRALRNGELLSWNAQGEKLLAEGKPEALAHLAQRPGYMLRSINRLLSLGYGEEAILEALLPAAASISAHLIVKTIRSLMKRASELDRKYSEARDLCTEGHRVLNAPIRPNYEELRSSLESKKRILLKDGHRRWWVVPQNLAREEIYGGVKTLQEELNSLKAQSDQWKAVLERIRDISENRYRIRNAGAGGDFSLLFAAANPAAAFEAAGQAERALREKEEELRAEKEKADQAFAARVVLIKEEYEQKCRDWEERLSLREEDLSRKYAQEMARYRKDLAEYEKNCREEDARIERELTALQSYYEQQKRSFEFDPQTVEILKALLREHFCRVQTPLRNKKVYLDLAGFDLAHSTLETEDRSKDGGYIRSGIAFAIPEECRYLRFFVYWNDRVRVDIDLHAGAKTTGGESFHVGWNADFRKTGVVHSGDITHSDAAEYIDIDMAAPISEIYANVDLYSGRESFRKVETCYVGIMAVHSPKQDVKLYDPANCFFTHALTQETRGLFYGFIDVPNRCVRFVGQPNGNEWDARPDVEKAEERLSLQDYLDLLLAGQGAELAERREEADVVLSMGKSLDVNGISFADANFFLEC